MPLYFWPQRCLEGLVGLLAPSHLNISLSSPPSKLRIIAKASYGNDKNLSNKIRSPKSRSWHNKVLSDIISLIAIENKFESLIDQYFNDIYISHIDQTAQSDLSFLVNLSQNYNAIILQSYCLITIL